MRLLLSLLLLCVALPVRAATGLSTPVFTNFFQQHFIVAPNAPPTQIIKSRIFGPATNIFNLTTNIYNNSYFVESNVTQIIDDSTIIITNTTINITNVTFIVNGQTNDITQLWRTNAQGIYFPAITNTATIVVGQNAETWWSPTLADGFVSIHDASVGDSQFNSMAIAAIDNVLQENYGTFTSTLGSGAAPAGAMQLLAATNWQNPSAPFSKFSVALQPAYGEVLLDLMNNGVHEFSVSNQITSVQALQLVPLTNITLGLGANQINVQSNSYVALQASFADPTTTEIDLSTGLRDGMLLLLKNIGVASGFTLFNGSPLYDDPTKYVTLSGGNWATTNYGESILLSGGLNGWSEVGRFTQNTNIQTAQLWELVSGHMRTVPYTLDDWQFRYGGVPMLTVGTNGNIVEGVDSTALYGFDPKYVSLLSLRKPSSGAPLINEIHVGTVMDTYGGGNYGEFYSTARTNYAGMFASTQLGGDFSEIGAIADNTSGTPSTRFYLEPGGVYKTTMEPTRVDGLVPYIFDTTLTHTGDLMEVKNNGTNQLAFGPDARITFGTGNSNCLFRSGSTLAYTNENAIFDVKTSTTGLRLSASANPTLSSVGGNGLFLDGNTNYVALMHSGAPAWYVGGVGIAGHLLTASDGVQNIGLSGNNRPGTINVKTNIVLNPITKAQKTALTPAEGMIVMQSDNTPGLRAYINGAWVMISTVADP